MHEPPPTSSTRNFPSGPAQAYLEWALETNFSYLRDGDWIPLLIEFDPKEARARSGNEKLTALEAFATRRWLHDNPRTLDDKFIIPELFDKPPELLLRASAFDFNFCVGLIRRDPEVVRQLIAAVGWNRTLVRLELGPPVNFAAKAPPKPPPGPTSLPMRPPLPRARDRNAGFLGRAGATIGRAIDWIKSKLFGAARLDLPRKGAPAPSAPKPPPVPPPATPPPSASPPGVPGPPASGSPPAPPIPGSSIGIVAGGGSALTIDRVVIAVIDQGIAFANSRFFDGGAPRIEYLWQQNLLSTAPSGRLVMPFTPGFELDKVAIQNAVTRSDAIGAGEDWLYRNNGGLSFSKDGYKPLARRRNARYARARFGGRYVSRPRQTPDHRGRHAGRCRRRPGRIDALRASGMGTHLHSRPR